MPVCLENVKYTLIPPEQKIRWHWKIKIDKDILQIMKKHSIHKTSMVHLMPD